MPYYKKTYKKRRTYKPRARPSGFNNALTIASKAFKMATALKGIINSELKYLDTETTPTPVDWNGIVIALSAIDQGDTAQTRDGNSVLAKYLNIKGIIKNTSSTVGSTVKFAIVSRKESQGAMPAVSDLYVNLGNANSPYSRTNFVQSPNDFKILMQKIVVLDNINKPSYLLDINIPLNFHLKFRDIMGADTSQNPIYMIVISDTDTTASPPEIQFWNTLRFYDN